MQFSGIDVIQLHVFGADGQHMPANRCIHTGQQWTHLEPVAHHTQRMQWRPHHHLHGKIGCTEPHHRPTVLGQHRPIGNFSERDQYGCAVETPTFERLGGLLEQPVERTVFETVVRVTTIDGNHHSHAR